MSFNQSLNNLARSLLYLWVRSQSLPAHIEQLNIDPDKPVVYVMYARDWSNLLVLEHECQRHGLPYPLQRINQPELANWHSVYTIAPRQPFKAWLQKQTKRSRMLRGIVASMRELPELEIQFVPVTLFWGRPVAKQKHWLQVLFADSWGMAGRTRKLLTILFQGRQTLLTFSEALVYRGSDFVGPDEDALLDCMQQRFVDRLNEMKTATLGPDVSHRRTLVRHLLLTDSVQNAISKRGAEDTLSNYEAALQARRYLDEIVADCTNISIALMQRLLTWFWNRFYRGIEVTNNAYLKNLALSHELVYVPCHRSHIDYLLLSYVLHCDGLALPYIAAGKNLDMPIIGSILRGGGAFFIRRSFKGNELYSTVMFEYLASLLALGVSVEYFIEGGRSRTGRLLKPRPGMLAMTIRGFLQYRKKPVAFIPVYIGYEKLLESKAYLAELGGDDKKHETLLSTLRAMFSIRGNYGKVYVNFAPAVYLDQLLDAQHASWRDDVFDQTIRPDWLKRVVTTSASRIMQSINQAVSVNPVNLVATILLSTSKQHMDEQDLIKTIDLYRTFIKALDYSGFLEITGMESAQIITHVEALRLIQRRKHAFGDIMYFDRKHAVTMTYYRNNALHLLALPSLIACCFLNMRSQTREQIHNLVRLAYPFIKAELYLVWSSSQLPGVVDFVLDMLSQHGMLIKNAQLDVYTRPGSGSAHYTNLKLLSRSISPLLEVYYLTLALLSRSVAQRISKHELENQCYLMAQRVSMIHELNSPDYSDKKLISNFIDTLIATEFLRDADTGHLRFGDAFLQADKHARLLLGKEVRTNILQMLKINQ